MDDERIIKKYPNRRLYDTGVSKYVTLADLRSLVKDSIKFRVIDVKTEDDITRNILMQIITEEEDKGSPFFSTEVLEQIIRSYGDAMQGFMSNYLKESLELFLQQQRLMQEQMAGLIKTGPLSVLSDLAQQNVRLWQDLQQSALNSYGLGPQARTEDKP
ncbi:MAG: polyhydroxyalkanoate synthesis repressor PhaR [Methylotetracoccus sp.]|jgi:polyhydroxyalkanoate synthesis repressor PhaR|nr:polyhydroxyalkanoate synthesis repressor PhaR [Methylotetracoccus sp.]